MAQPIWGHSPMLFPDYADLVTVTAAGADRNLPEEWLRAAVERAFGGPAGRLLLRGLLHLRPTDAPGGVAGWDLAGRGDGWVRIESSSPLLTCHIVVQVEGDEVAAATLVRYGGELGARRWRRLARHHRRLMRALLRRAARALAPLPV
ncbi:hypothetical protein ACFQV2_38210 [Actinokineospora soli]|uniref:DUF2867 domain-containing protein n=1 Tax=Actinokineospora soli TaxID=1048753 RepID=A0ABW2TYE1_9PSEU